MTREEFIREVTDGLTTPPAYFPLNVKMNKEGYKAIEDVLSGGMTPLTSAAGALVLDVRTQEEYAEAHIPRSLFIGLDGKFAPWVGELVADVTHPIVLVAPPGKEEEAVTRLSRVGFDRTLGYLKGGIEAWKKAGKETDNLTCIKPQDFAERYAQIKDRIFDVRRPGEYQSEHIVNAKSIPLAELHSRLSELPDGKDFYLYCGTAYRSTIASSVLKMRGIHNFVNVSGGFKAVKETPVPVTAYVCPSTLSA
ncbi:hypothetical protein CHS0354_002069 [Potamilus streckersoni]|uniref:Rhodanese domain-containing protein n=1 Tax=Potamilus streckersoni TaxID=2493646 RepID=A0AAE0W7F4_9BIVA|nr:hypothetical protein CHS0354_002069 [Potamilus streckersoni]